MKAFGLIFLSALVSWALLLTWNFRDEILSANPELSATTTIPPDVIEVTTVGGQKTTTMTNPPETLTDFYEGGLTFDLEQSEIDAVLEYEELVKNQDKILKDTRNLLNDIRNVHQEVLDLSVGEFGTTWDDKGARHMAVLEETEALFNEHGVTMEGIQIQLGECSVQMTVQERQGPRWTGAYYDAPFTIAICDPAYFDVDTLVHEFAHHIEYKIVQYWNEQNDCYFDWESCEDTVAILNWDEQCEHVSDYACTNEAEFVAETITHYIITGEELFYLDKDGAPYVEDLLNQYVEATRND